VKVSELLRKAPRPATYGICLLLIAAIGAVDYITGPELSISILYLLPVSMASWWVGRRPGLLAAMLASVTWLAADLLSDHTYSIAAIPYWNAIVRLGFFVIVSESLSALQISKIRQDELSQFIVHDLRSPLGNVISGLETLKEVSEDRLDDSQTLLIQTALSSSNRMLTLIDSLLDLARLEHGSMPVKPVDIVVEEIVEASLQQVVNMATQREVLLSTDFAEPGLNARADPDLTNRVIVNLLTNAIRVSEPGASVVARAGRRDGLTWVSVSDSGPGIPEKWLDKVFDKFSQIDARKTGGFKGSGLGLAFCRRAVEAQGGRIWLESQVNEGTTVTFTLPPAAGPE
jgi:NtrC-family two-component system sensor histidine kinase KinB